MARRPLSVRNVDHALVGGKPRKERYPFPLLDRPTLVDSLRQVTKEVNVSPPLSITEEELAKPTPEKVQQIYFTLLNLTLSVTPELLKQPTFVCHQVEHPEILEDATYRLQFFRVMRQFMEACLVDDFKLTDLMCPEPKRTCRHLSALINFIKFHWIYWDNSSINELQEAVDQTVEEIQRLQEENRDLREKLIAIERQRCEEHELEEELKQNIAAQEQEVQALKMQQDSLQQQYQTLFDQNCRNEQRLAELSKELEKWTSRNNDLKKQIVSSPQKLKARLAQLQQQVEEVKRSSKQSESILRMWEALASRAQQVPSVLRGLNEDNDMFMAKVGKRSELHSHFEAIEEHVSRQKQALKEATAKHQNLLRHQRLVEEESRHMAYEDQRMPHSQAKEDLQRDVYLLHEELHRREATDAHLRQETEEQKQMLAERKAKHEQACTEIDEMTRALKGAYETQKKKLADVNCDSFE